MWFYEASEEWVGGWWDACEVMESDCSWEVWNMGGEI